ncbi:MAG TPA: hypothetical protein VGH27_34235 [Streptosporangiaceae bacterium]|jgi:hypothetical protein
MTEQNPETTYDPGTVDETQHGWSPDAPGEGGAKEQVIAGNQKAFEGNDTQEAATGEAIQGPDLTGGNVGQSSTTRGEDMQERDGKEAGRENGPPQGESERPTGTSTARDSTGVDPQDPVDDDSPGLQPGDQGG